MVSEIITQINGPFFHGVSIVSPGKSGWKVPDVQAITSSGEVAEENAYSGRFLRDHDGIHGNTCLYIYNDVYDVEG